MALTPALHRIVVIALLPILIALTQGHAANMSFETAVTYILETAKAFRTVYAKGVVEKAGIEPREHWEVKCPRNHAERSIHQGCRRRNYRLRARTHRLHAHLPVQSSQDFA